MKTMTKIENETSVILKSSFVKNGRFKKLVVSLTIVNDDPSLTRRREETALKGIDTYHWAVLKKISRSFSSPTT